MGNFSLSRFRFYQLFVFDDKRNCSALMQHPVPARLALKLRPDSCIYCSFKSRGHGLARDPRMRLLSYSLDNARVSRRRMINPQSLESV
ncbi:hypothetical protein Ppro_1143 [Pelobacter propionicus DSM 2379]|uniref:Uncharacterized protein n=1 Tax=Pelobacter propionicus (strain DSM 2379 / NBRC 103807 / OttBd1) TaxID=338966 RepID=A1AN47_PELPD|nr:hypothetical protein Ppro_1143 [Pelobacter propionicus DSM 2379]